MNFSICNSTLHGTGLCASHKIKQGDIIISENPINFLQTLPNKQDVIICANCFSFIGSLQLHLKLLSKDISRGDISLENDDMNADSNGIIFCPNGCGELYCSTFCRDKHYADRHRLLCTGCINEVLYLCCY
jgi:hypothetical protein